jgi:hypothetical protein
MHRAHQLQTDRARQFAACEMGQSGVSRQKIYFYLYEFANIHPNVPGLFSQLSEY